MTEEQQVAANSNLKTQQQPEHTGDSGDNHLPLTSNQHVGANLEECFLSSEYAKKDIFYLKMSSMVFPGDLVSPIVTANNANQSQSTTVCTTPIATSASETRLMMKPPLISLCTNPHNCVSLKNILDSFKTPLSEEQAWAVLYQFMILYRAAANAESHHIFNDLEIPEAIDNLSLHRDGSVHCSWTDAERLQKEHWLLQHQQQHSSDVEDRDSDTHDQLFASHKKILRKLAVIVYNALDYNLQADEQCQMSTELEELITFMTADDNDDDCIDEGIDEGDDKRWDDCAGHGTKCNEVFIFNFVLQACENHVKPTVSEDHYKAVCRALVTEAIELRTFLQQVFSDGAENLHLKSGAQTSKQELAKLGFNDWALFWVQVIDELRRGVRLKKRSYSRTPIEYELTPYEILMEDIRSKNYQLRKVMVNGVIPPRVRKDAHALILEFIRSRPPLKKASERELPPPSTPTPSPREQLMDSIRQGQALKHIPQSTRIKNRLLPPLKTGSTASLTSATATSLATRPTMARYESAELSQSLESHTAPGSKQRLIKVDFSLLQDENDFCDAPGLLDITETNTNSQANHLQQIALCSQPKMPPYPIGGYMVPGDGSDDVVADNSARVLRRTNIDVVKQSVARCPARRRHTIVGCQSNFDCTTPPLPTTLRLDEESTIKRDNHTSSETTQFQPHNNYNQINNNMADQMKASQCQRVSTHSGTTAVIGEGNSLGHSPSVLSGRPWNKSFLDEKTWQERGDDRLSLTLEEIVHIRSVMTKAELESLPVGVRIKEDVERRKVCFLCLRTRFSIFGPWGIQCKLCQRTVCSKCYTKMHIPSDHFRNVPLVLISPSLLASPASSNTPSPSHQAPRQAQSSLTGNILDETFPKTLIERLLRSESERKSRNLVGSAPASPRYQRSNISTPGIVPLMASSAHPAIDAAHEVATTAEPSNTGMALSYTSGAMSTSVHNSHCTNTKEKQTAKGNHKSNCHFSIMARSVEGPSSLPVHSPARPHSNSSTLDRKNRFPRAFMLYSSGSGTQLNQEQKENIRGEQVHVCHDCKGLVMEITRSSKQTRSSARNRALQNLTLDLSPVYK